MTRTAKMRAATACLAVSFLVLCFGSEAGEKQNPSAEEPTSVFLRQRLPEVDRMPPCTPLLIAAGGPKSLNTTLEHLRGLWGPIKVTTIALEQARPVGRFTECLAAVAEYEGRYTEDQAEAFRAGRLTIGMPVEFALMLMGPSSFRWRHQEAPSSVTPPDNATASGREATIDRSPRDLSQDESSEIGSRRLTAFRWAGWLVEVRTDPAGQIERIILGERDIPVLYYEPDSRSHRVSSRSPGTVAVTTDDAAQPAYSQAMAVYESGDRIAAMELLLPIAEVGHPPSQYAVGDMLYRGDGVERDLDEAAIWIGKAAAARLPGALYHLGFLQLRGEGVAQDPVEAYVSMHWAAELGNVDAPTVLERLEQRLDASQLAEAEERIEAAGFHSPVLTHKVEPKFPVLPRVARLSGHVVLQAKIRVDGTVADLEVLQTSQPNMGFEQAAIDAVSQWRYEPARRKDNDDPVEVYFTIFVAFNLR